MNNNLVKGYKFFRSLNISAVSSIELARAEVAADDKLMVIWEDENLPWDGEGEAPNVYLFGYVIEEKEFDDYRGTTKRGANIYASLGGVGLDTHHDPFQRVYAAELLCEALIEWDKEVSRRAIEYASEHMTLAHAAA